MSATVIMITDHKGVSVTYRNISDHNEIVRKTQSIRSKDLFP